MRIEQASVADAPAILSLQYNAYQSEALIYDNFSIPPLTQSLNEIIAQFRDHIFLIAVVDNQIVGSVRATLRDTTCHIERLAVHPAYQHQGGGTALIHAIEAMFPQAKRYELFTGHKSERNIALYQRLGYREARCERISDQLTIVTMIKEAGST